MSKPTGYEFGSDQNSTLSVANEVADKLRRVQEELMLRGMHEITLTFRMHQTKDLLLWPLMK